MQKSELRLRRLRENPLVRKLVSENTLYLKDLVQPLFVKEGLLRPVEISSMPGQFQHSEKSLVAAAEKIQTLGVPAVILFGIPVKKDSSGYQAFAKKGIIQRAVAQIKKRCQSLLVITDVCLCEYLSHGHCGLLKKRPRSIVRSPWQSGYGLSTMDYRRIENDTTVKVLAKIAVSHARAGADIVAPSDMMDGRVRAIRQTLDKNDFKHLPILSYAVKYASAFYAPFRDAAQSAPEFGDRASYQMNSANIEEALREAELDIAEGADMILVKPALGCGDVIRRLREALHCPIGCYSVSGEYSMIKAASQKKWLDEKKAVLETHLSMKRAGAAFILTYWAGDLAKWLKK